MNDTIKAGRDEGGREADTAFYGYADELLTAAQEVVNEAEEMQRGGWHVSDETLNRLATVVRNISVSAWEEIQRVQRESRQSTTVAK